jgi:hypothetical protein
MTGLTQTLMVNLILILIQMVINIEMKYKKFDLINEIFRK